MYFSAILWSERITYLLTYSTVQSPSWEANWFAASQEILRIFMEPEGSLPHSQVSATCPCPGPAQSSPNALATVSFTITPITVMKSKFLYL